MTTTVMRNSIVGDDWIRQSCANVPCQYVLDQETRQPTGDILTGPVRLAFDYLFEPPKATPSMPNPKYGAALLFTPFTDFTVLFEEYYKKVAEAFADRYDAGSGQYVGLHSPFRDQVEKAKFGGFTPGCVFISVRSDYKPPLVDARYNPIVDKAKVYPGVWAICSINAYVNKPDKTNPAKKIGIGFGLQSVMIIGDDEKFGGGAPDPNKTFAGVGGAITAPSITAAQAQGMPAGNAAGQPGMPPPPTGGTYAAAQGTYAPAPARSPVGVAPSAPPGYAQMPGQPIAAQDPRGPVPAGFGSWAEYDDLMG